MTTETTHKSILPPKVSIGERLFDFGTYVGVGGVGTFLATIPLTYWFKYSMAEQVHWASKQMVGRFGMHEHTAEKLLTTSMLMQGGNLGVLLIKPLENYKIQIVEALNSFFGDKTDISEMKEAPKQTWTSLIVGRLLAFAVVYLSFEGATKIFGKQRFENFEAGFSKNVVCEPLGCDVATKAGEETVAYRVGKIAALDTFATTAATTLLYFGSKFVAALGFKKPDHEAPAPATRPPAEKAPLLEYNHDSTAAARLLTRATAPASHQQHITTQRSELKASPALT